MSHYFPFGTHPGIQSQDVFDTFLIQSVYRAAYDPEAWSDTLNTLCRSCGAQAAKLVFFDTLTLSTYHSVAVGVHSDKAQRNTEFMVYAVPLFIHPRQIHLAGVYTWFFIKPSDISMDEWTQMTLEKLTSRIQLISEKRYVGFLLLQHPEAKGDFSWADARLMSFLKSHFKQSILLFAKAHDSPMSRQLESDILNKLNVGILVMDGAGRILRKNRTVSLYLNAEDGLYINNGLVTTQSGSQCNFITDLCWSAEQQRSGLKIVQRPSGKPGYQIFYFPLSESLTNIPDKTGIMLFIFDPDHTSDTLMESIQMAFDLGKVQSRLAAHISRGMTAEEYAEANGVSVATVRTQLRSIYKRTDTKGQARLTHLIRGMEFLNLTENIDTNKVITRRKRRRKQVYLSQFITAIVDDPSGETESQ